MAQLPYFFHASGSRSEQDNEFQSIMKIDDNNYMLIARASDDGYAAWSGGSWDQRPTRLFRIHPSADGLPVLSEIGTVGLVRSSNFMNDATYSDAIDNPVKAGSFCVQSYSGVQPLRDRGFWVTLDSDNFYVSAFAEQANYSTHHNSSDTAKVFTENGYKAVIDVFHFTDSSAYFTNWGGTIELFNSSGTKLWSRALVGSGIMDVIGMRGLEISPTGDVMLTNSDGIFVLRSSNGTLLYGKDLAGINMGWEGSWVEGSDGYYYNRDKGSYLVRATSNLWTSSSATFTRLNINSSSFPLGADTDWTDNTYNEDNNLRRRLAMDAAGKIWIADGNGVMCFDPATQGFDGHYTIVSNATYKPRINALSLSDDGLVIAGCLYGDANNQADMRFVAHLALDGSTTMSSTEVATLDPSNATTWERPQTVSIKWTAGTQTASWSTFTVTALSSISNYASQDNLADLASAAGVNASSIIGTNVTVL